MVGEDPTQSRQRRSGAGLSGQRQGLVPARARPSRWVLHPDQRCARRHGRLHDHQRHDSTSRTSTRRAAASPIGPVATTWPTSTSRRIRCCRCRAAFPATYLRRETFPQGSEFVGKAGDAIFWHGQTFHTGSKNVNRNIRMALIGRFSRKDTNDIRFETCGRPMGALGGD